MITTLVTLSCILAGVARSYIPAQLQCHTEIQVIQVTRYGTVCTTDREQECVYQECAGCDNLPCHKKRCRKLQRLSSDKKRVTCQEVPRKVCKEVQVEIPKQVRKKVCQKLVSWGVWTKFSWLFSFMLTIQKILKRKLFFLTIGNTHSISLPESERVKI